MSKEADIQKKREHEFCPESVHLMKWQEEEGEEREEGDPEEEEGEAQESWQQPWAREAPTQ